MSDAEATVKVPRWALRFVMDNACFQDEGPMLEGWRSNEMRRATDALEEALEMPSSPPPLKDDPRYEKVKELVAKNPPPAGVMAVIPRRIWREVGFTDEEIDERHSLGRNLR